MSTEVKEKKTKKIDKLRKREYHPTLQRKFDELYQKSKDGTNFNNLLPLITSTDNIILAVRNIKGNRGKNTKGTNRTVMQNILDQPLQETIKYVRKRFSKYQPQTIKRVNIPKSNGKTRPLGIPTMEERLLQQCILQVLEPIAEAKFINQSFGFRPHRSIHHAQARVNNILMATECEYVVDMDIKSFFDNVSHSKLIKQLYSLGIHDKSLLSIIKRMLKAGVVEVVFPTKEYQITKPEKGTPQGGILSPLLANIVLNEFDHWVVNQWEEFQTEMDFTKRDNKHRALKRTRLKRMYYVRYADDFRIFTNIYSSAVKIYKAAEMWLKERLKLEVSQEKSSIIKLKQKNMNFLGITFKLVKNPKLKQHAYNRKAAEYVPYTSISKETYKKIKQQIRDRIIKLKHTFYYEDRIKAIRDYNSYIRGLKFYAVTSKWCNISSQLNWNTRAVRYNRLKRIFKTRKYSPRTNLVEVGEFKKKRDKISVNGIELLSPTDIKHFDIFQFNPKICKYTKEGRKLVHDLRRKDISYLFKYFEENWEFYETVEYNTNRMAALSRQQGLCAISGSILQVGLIETHHKKPIKDGGTNKTDNLYLLNKWAHQLIHTIDINKIREIYTKLKQSVREPIKDRTVLKNLNKFRELVGNGKLNLKQLTIA